MYVFLPLKKEHLGVKSPFIETQEKYQKKHGEAG